MEPVSGARVRLLALLGLQPRGLGLQAYTSLFRGEEQHVCDSGWI